MSRLEDLYKEITTLVDGVAVDETMWESWRTHPVTQKLMLDVERQIIDEAFSAHINFSNVEETALKATASNSAIRALQSIIDWQPWEEE